jgi:hypothetical protein
MTRCFFKTPTYDTIMISLIINYNDILAFCVHVMNDTSILPMILFFYWKSLLVGWRGVSLLSIPATALTAHALTVNLMASSPAIKLVSVSPRLLADDPQV